METTQTFIPTAATSGLLPMLAWYSMVVAMYALAASVVFSWLTRTHVAPEHNTSRTLTAALCLVAAISYFFIQDYYRQFLGATGGPPTLDETRAAYLAIGQFRYMDWAITTPLLLVKMFMMLDMNPDDNRGLYAVALVGDLFMIVAGYIGDQMIGAGGDVLAGPRFVWGAVSTVSYVAVVWALWTARKRHRAGANPWAGRAFDLGLISVVTFWGVYPVGYILVGIGDVDLDWVQIAFSVADVVNKVGFGVVVYLAGARILKERIDIKSPEYAIHVG